MGSRAVFIGIALVAAAGVIWHAQQAAPLTAHQEQVQPAAPPSAPSSTASAYAATPTAQAPAAALAYRSTLIRTARSVWGMDAPIAVFAAQLHQESAWKPDAVSHVGAQGLAQFMPATTEWIVQVDKTLTNPDPFNPAWSIRAMVVYDQWLFARTPARYSERDRMWVSLRAYNGGLGHWQREAASSGLAQPSREQVDAACGKARRAASHCRENLQYPARILNVHQPRYLTWGPGL